MRMIVLGKSAIHKSCLPDHMKGAYIHMVVQGCTQELLVIAS